MGDKRDHRREDFEFSERRGDGGGCGSNNLEHNEVVFHRGNLCIINLIS